MPEQNEREEIYKLIGNIIASSDRPAYEITELILAREQRIRDEALIAGAKKAFNISINVSRQGMEMGCVYEPDRKIERARDEWLLAKEEKK